MTDPLLDIEQKAQKIQQHYSGKDLDDTIHILETKIKALEARGRQ